MALQKHEPWKPYWTTPILQFEATKLPTIEEIWLHFMLPSLEVKLKTPLSFESAGGDKVSVIIFFMEKGGEGLILRGWTTDIQRGPLEVGNFIKKCSVKMRNVNTAVVMFEEKHNQEVWEVRIKE